MLSERHRNILQKMGDNHSGKLYFTKNPTVYELANMEDVIEMASYGYVTYRKVHIPPNINHDIYECQITDKGRWWTI